MLESQTQQNSEAQLAALLGELLEGEASGAAGEGMAGDVPLEIAEMRDMARLLRAASQSVPLPEGRLAVRRALLATLPPSGPDLVPARAAWRRTGRWLSVVAVLGMLVAAFGVGAGMLDGIDSPSNPLYSLRRAADRVRTAFAPVAPRGTPSPLGSGQAGTVEMSEFSRSGYARPAGLTGYPLTFRFNGVTVPSVPGQEVTMQGTVGGLPVTLSLTATTGCPSGGACGLFEAWVTQLHGTRASAEFGQMRGTFVCATGKCTLTPMSKTGVFNTVSAFVSQWTASGELAGLVETGFTSLGDWVGTVEQVAVQLKNEDLLPAGVNVADLVRDAATNQSAPKRPSPQGKPAGSVPSGNPTMPGAAMPTSTSEPGITMGTGVGTGPSSRSGKVLEGTGTSDVPSTSTSTSVSRSGVTVTTSGSVSTPSGTPNATVSTSTSTSGTSGSTSVNVSGSTGTSSSSASGSGTASGGTNFGGGSSGGSGSVNVNTNAGGGSSGGSWNGNGGTNAGGGASAGGSASGGAGTSSGGASASGSAGGGASASGGGASASGSASGGASGSGSGASASGTASGGANAGGGGAPSGGGGISIGLGGIGISIGSGGISVSLGGGGGAPSGGGAPGPGTGGTK